MITLAPPLPPQSGGSRYTVNTTLQLCEKYDFHLLSVGGNKEREHIEQHADLYRSVFKSVELIPRATIPTQSLIAQVGHVIRHFQHKLPFWDASYYDARGVSVAKRIVQEHEIDALEIHTAHLAFFKRFFPSIPGLLVYHNMEGDLFPFWIQDGWSKTKKAIISRLAKLSRSNTRAVEIENSFGFQEAIFISSQDMLRVTAPDLNKTYVPMCIPVQPSGVEKAASVRCSQPVNALWLGGFWWYPNADAVDYFLNEIYPLLAERLEAENLVLNFVGANPPEALRAIAGSHVKVHGFVEDLDELLGSMDFMFVPMRLGSGVRVKILEAMASGLPVVSTPKGHEGLNAINGEHLIDASTPQDFAESMLSLTRDSALRQRLAENAIALLDRDYNPQRYSDEVDKVYQRMLKSGPHIDA